MKMKIKNETKNTLIANNASMADTFLKRFLGLMGKEVFIRGEGLLIVPCNSIHMFFMKLSIDVIFIDNNNIVIHLIENIRPWQISRIIWKAKGVIELPVGTIKKSKTFIKDKLTFND